MRVVCLGSGSRGNATLVDCGGTRVLVDCGFAGREAERRLAAVGVSAKKLDAILVTHEHGDHVRGVGALASRFGIDVWATSGTWRQAGGGNLPGLRLFSGHQGDFRIGDFRVAPYPVPHDAREPCQFVFEHAGSRFGMLTDAGHVTSHTRHMLRDCDALMLECNHDTDMLRAGPYPPTLKARVGGGFGHLSNLQAAELLDSLPLAGLRHLLVAHISAKNNSPDLVRRTLRQVSADLELRLTLADQDRPGPWLEL
jgi:phosphoribosyl 1,2-cyclic phosphodiesterase